MGTRTDIKLADCTVTTEAAIRDQSKDRDPVRGALMADTKGLRNVGILGHSLYSRQSRDSGEHFPLVAPAWRTPR
jgi:hypothetical protein